MSSLSLQTRKTTQPTQGGICTGKDSWARLSYADFLSSLPLPLSLSLARSTWASYKLLAISLMNLQLLWLLSTIGHFTLPLSLAPSSPPLPLAALPCQLTVKCFSKLACHTEAAALRVQNLSRYYNWKPYKLCPRGPCRQKFEFVWSTLKIGCL